MKYSRIIQARFSIVGSGLRYISPLLTDDTREPVIGGRYLSPRSAGSLTAQTLNSLDNTCHCLSRYTREHRRGRPRGRQWLSLRSSRQWALTAQVSPARGRVTDRAPTTTVRALRDDAGPHNDADGWGRRSGQFRATGRFETTWQFWTTRSPYDLSVDTAAEPSE